MEVHTQRHKRLEPIAKLVEGVHVCMLTSVDAQGKLLSRPMAALEMDAEGDFWFFTSDSSAKTHQLDEVNIAFSDEGRANYVSVSGHGEVVRDRNRIDDLWTPMAKPWFPNGKDDPDLVLLKVTTHLAEYWSANGSRVARLLAMAASAAVGKPLAQGEHDVIQAPRAYSRGTDPHLRTFESD